MVRLMFITCTNQNMSSCHESHKKGTRSMSDSILGSNCRSRFCMLLLCMFNMHKTLEINTITFTFLKTRPSSFRYNYFQ